MGPERHLPPGLTIWVLPTWWQERRDSQKLSSDLNLKQERFLFFWGGGGRCVEWIPAVIVNIYFTKVGQNKPLGRIWKWYQYGDEHTQLLPLTVIVFYQPYENSSFLVLCCKRKSGFWRVSDSSGPTQAHFLSSGSWALTREAIVWVTAESPGSKGQCNNFLVANHQTSANRTSKIQDTAFPPSLSEI